MAIATLLFIALWRFIKRQRPLLTRGVAGGPGVTHPAWLVPALCPNALITVERPLNFFTEAAPRATLLQLTIALLVGSAFIFPGLIFLLRVFKLKKPDL